MHAPAQILVTLPLPMVRGMFNTKLCNTVQSASMSANCNCRGWHLANSSITSGTSIEMAQCVCRSNSPDSLSVVVHEQKAVLIRLSPPNDLSAEHVVMGKLSARDTHQRSGVWTHRSGVSHNHPGGTW